MVRHGKPWVVVILKKIPKEAPVTSGVIPSSLPLLANTVHPFRIELLEFCKKYLES